MASAAVATAATSSSSASALTMNDSRANAASHNAAPNNTTTVSDSSRGGAQQNGASQEASRPQQNQNLQNQVQQTTELRPPAPVDAENTSSRLDKPLPVGLRRILVQVAKTGACPWMSWDHEMEISSTASPVMTAAKASIGMTRQPFSTHRRSQGPPRKKHRNGHHKGNSRRRFGAADASKNSAGGGRKRPLFLIRTNPNSGGSTFPAPGSVGSGRTSGSEPDDSTQYECDSEGTSTTSNSEVSVERLRKTQQLVNVNALQAQNNKVHAVSTVEESHATDHSDYHYKTLQEAFRVALGLVLDHFYKQRGGYKLAPAEKRRNETLSASDKSNNEKRIPPLSPDAVFRQRRQRLVNVLLPENKVTSATSRQRKSTSSNGYPFTIQRIAEVLVAPERYYTQTHKLCNCLEKLLLVRSSTAAFGGSTGGDTAQSRREEREMAALADEKGRQESELRQRRLRRRTASPSDDAVADSSNEWGTRLPAASTKDDGALNDRSKSPTREKKEDGYGHSSHRSSQKGGSNRSSEESRALLEAAARASLRTKFDHVGIDPHSSPDRDVRSIAENRGMTNSPPPPSLAMSAAPSNIAMQNHSGVTGFVRQHLPEQNGDHHLARVPSPILFSPSNESPMHSTTNMHMLQLHHAVALAGASLGRGTPSPLDLMAIEGAVRQHGNLASVAENADGRSSTSNSDVDSESDDISLDDSASDRSDGSDSGSVTHYEPFTAARAMALNRMQQQQRLQSRVLTSLNLHQSEGFRPPADSEYQSGDSIDSTRAEDSGGSDSSSSDLAD